MLGRLACCIGLMLLAGAGQAAAEPQLANIFYKDDRQAQARTLDSDLRLPPAWLHDCATRIGDSGGALFRIGDNGRPVLLGVVHAEGKRRSEILSVWTPAHSNFAVPVANFIDRIHPYLAGVE